MAFDGITIANIRKELDDTLTGGRIFKIAQPEPDELLLTIKNNGAQHRLTLSASASLPLIYLTGKNKTSPMTAPQFLYAAPKAHPERQDHQHHPSPAWSVFSILRSSILTRWATYAESCSLWS